MAATGAELESVLERIIQTQVRPGVHQVSAQADPALVLARCVVRPLARLQNDFEFELHAQAELLVGAQLPGATEQDPLGDVVAVAVHQEQLLARVVVAGVVQTPILVPQRSRSSKLIEVKSGGRRWWERLFLN